MEILRPALPPDQITRELSGNFKGSGFVYKKTEIGLKVEEVMFDIVSNDPLNPFFYNRPVEDPSDPFSSPREFIKDLRSGYFLLAKVNQALRPPKSFI